MCLFVLALKCTYGMCKCDLNLKSLIECCSFSLLRHLPFPIGWHGNEVIIS